MKKTSRFLATTMIFAALFCIGNCKTVSHAADTVHTEFEPNNDTSQAQEVVLGDYYAGILTATDDSRNKSDENYDEDYYKIYVQEGSFYRIILDNIEDIHGDKSGTMIVKLFKETNTGDSSTLLVGDYQKTDMMFRADYSGYYYLRFYNSLINTKYSFLVKKQSVVGQKVKDSDSNTYKITGNNSMELIEVASKKAENVYLDDKGFSNIGGVGLAEKADFKITSIGKHAFKGCAINRISIPASVTKIGVGAFQNCKKLGTASLMIGVVIHGDKVTIDKNAFSGCSKLGSIRVLKSASIKSVGKNAFKGTKDKIRVEVPNIAKYKKIFKKAGLKNPKFENGYV